MTFDEVKSAILENARRFEVCDVFHDMVAATDYPELIRAALPLFEYGWRTGVITTALLDEIPSSDLEDFGIFYNSSGAVTVPPTFPFPFFDSYEIFLIGGMPSVTFTGTKKYKVNAWSTTATVNIDTNTYLDLKVYGSAVTLNMEDDSIAVINGRNRADVMAVNMSGNSTADITLELYTVLNLDITGNSFAKLNAHAMSVANVNVANDPEFIMGNNYGSSTINYSVV